MRAISQTQANLNRKGPPGDPGLAPFLLREDDRLFFFGSCLTRVMERSFRKRGLTVLSTPIPTLANETTHGVSVVNRHIVPVMLQELKWAFGEETFPPESLIDAYGVGRWNDPQLPRATRSTTFERAIERRAELRRYFSRIADATVVFIELAVADHWFDRLTGLVIMGDGSPIPRNRDPDRFEFHLRRYEDLRADLLDLRAAIARFSRADRIILTLSPMPLRITFRSADGESDTAYNRAVLRAVAGDLADDFEDIAYSPTFERIMSRPSTEIYKEDGAHVRDDVVEEAMAWLLRSFGIDRAPTEDEFDEAAYLAANADVAEGVRAGSLVSGYHHWLAEGRAAGRPLVASHERSEEPIPRDQMRAYITATLPARFYSHEMAVIEAVVANRGNTTFGNAGAHPVYLCYRWFDEHGARVDVGHLGHTSFPGGLRAGQSAEVVIEARAPDQPGTYTLSLTLVQFGVAWFDTVDRANDFRAEVVVTERPPFVPQAADAPPVSLVRSTH